MTLLVMSLASIWTMLFSVIYNIVGVVLYYDMKRGLQSYGSVATTEEPTTELCRT